MNRAVQHAERLAAQLRRQGYREAHATPQYCIDHELGEDNFVTYTVSVYAGPKTTPKPGFLGRLLGR